MMLLITYFFLVVIWPVVNLLFHQNKISRQHFFDKMIVWLLYGKHDNSVSVSVLKLSSNTFNILCIHFLQRVVH